LNVTIPTGTLLLDLYIRVPGSEFDTFDTNLTIHMNSIAGEFNNNWADRLLPVAQSWAEQSDGSGTDNGSSIVPSSTITDFDVSQMNSNGTVINTILLKF
jgi:hypothetical protein